MEGSPCPLWVASEIILRPHHSPGISAHDVSGFVHGGQPKDEEDEGPVTPERSPQSERLSHLITTTSKSKKGR